jgi:hypothetical protein
VIPVRYELHLHIRRKAIPVTGAWRVTGVLRVRYEHLPHIKSKAIPITDRGGPYV